MVNRYALVQIKDGLIVHILTLDLDDEKGTGYVTQIEKDPTRTLVLLADTADEMGGVAVEPNDLCIDIENRIFKKQSV